LSPLLNSVKGTTVAWYSVKIRVVFGVGCPVWKTKSWQ